MSWMDVHDPAVEDEVAAVASRVAERHSDVANDIRDIIQDVVPALRGDADATALLGASVHENVDTALHLLRHEMQDVTAPNAAVQYARRLAQQDVGMAPLLRSYRVGQTRFQRDFIAELLRGRDGDHVEGAAALLMVERVSGYVDSVVEQVIEAYERARDEWLTHRSAVQVQHVTTLLRERTIDDDDAQAMLGTYRVAQHHLGAVVSFRDEGSRAGVALAALSEFARSLATAAGSVGQALFVPRDECTAWVWLPLADRGALEREPLETLVDSAEQHVALALGDPLAGLDGFRRTHCQSVLAHAVALAAKPAISRFTPFSAIAPIAPMCSDLDAARAWVGETLGALAIDDERSSLLRETARVFLESGNSFTATANRMMLHRNTAQYRIRKAEELRGRSLRDGRLDVEVALLACHCLGRTVLQPPAPDAEAARPDERLAPQLS